MTKLNILTFPDARLRNEAQPVTVVNNEIRQIIADMFETMYAASGIGLAATQVNIHQRIITIDISEGQNEPITLINPSFEILDDTPGKYQEGCLSVPGFYEEIERPLHIEVNALNEKGEEYSFVATDLLAICVQHEIDHLNGKLFIDSLSNLKRARIRKKLEKKNN